MQKKIDLSKFSHTDERDKIIKAAKNEAAAMSLYSQAEEIFGTKRWEDDWKRIFQMAAPAGYIGNIVSIVLGTSGGVFLAYQLTSNWGAAVLIGAIVTLIMEAAKSVSLREGVIHALKGKSSAAVLFTVAISMLLASAYFSVESGKKTPYFQRWVNTETGDAPTLLPTNKQDERLTKIAEELRAIENERASYEQRNPTKTAKWLKADTYERLKLEQVAIQKEQSDNSTEKAAAAYKTEIDATAQSLSWWYWCIVLLSEAYVIFGYCFRPYYIYRCRELAIAEGKSIKIEQFEVDSAPTHYEAQNLAQQQFNISDFEMLKRELEMLKQKQAGLPDTTPKSQIGFKDWQTPVFTVNTAEKEKKNSVFTVNTEQGQTAQTIKVNETTPDEMLLAAYRASNGSILSRKGRETEQSAIAIKYHEDRQQSIINILLKRGKTIKMVNRAYSIVDIT